VKYVSFEEHGSPQVLRVAEGPAPQPRPHDVLIEVEASGVGHADVMQRAGTYPPPKSASPILGLECSGTIAELGHDVVGYKVGDRVVALCNGGGYAKYVAVPAGQVLPLPDTWSFIEGATLPENAFTVYDNVLVRARLQPGEMLLAHGGTSGIGTTAIMFAQATGARVIVTCGSDEKCKAALAIGAEAAINYQTTDFVEQVRLYTHGNGVDVILDIVGGEYVERDLHCIATDGRIVCLTTERGYEAKVDLRYLLQRRAAIMGSSLRPRTEAEKAAIADGLRTRIWPMLAAREKIVPLVDSVFSFSDAAAAHTKMEASSHIGKIVLVPDEY
jgi:NADPH2:quinone reductase